MTDLVTLEEYKEFKGVKNTDKDGRRALLISLVSQLITTYCGREFTAYVNADKVEYFDARSTSVYLTEFPVISITHVKTSEDGGLTQTDLTVDSADADGYFVDLENGRIFTQVEGTNFLDYVDHPFRSLEVAYRAGYVDTFGDPGIPADLKLAVMDTVTYYEDNEKSLNKTLASATLENPEPTLSSDFPPHIKRILDLYRVLA